jgi:hypothetical protein
MCVCVYKQKAMYTHTHHKYGEKKKDEESIADKKKKEVLLPGCCWSSWPRE